MSTEDPDIGKVLSERYRLVRLLGEGASGRVYEARQAVGRAERRVAVKVLHARNAENPRLVRRIAREIEIVSSLAHPSTIKVYDFGETQDGRPFVVMEFIDGMPLSRLIEQTGAITLERTLNIFSQLCGALVEAHDRGIMHRDLKPENIMLMQIGGQKDLVKVLDFGIAKNVSPAREPETAITEHGSVVGTPEYMSPEQFSGASLGPLTDIYSLGVIAYEMLTGRLPFQAEDVLEWAARHALDPPPPFEQAGASGVPKSAEAAVLHALAKKADDRPATAGAFYAELAQALPGGAPPLGRPSSPPPEHSSERPRERESSGTRTENTAQRGRTATLNMDLTVVRPTEKRRHFLAVGAALLLVMAAVTALAFWPRAPWSRRTPPPLLPPPVTTETAPVDLGR